MEEKGISPVKSTLEPYLHRIMPENKVPKRWYYSNHKISTQPSGFLSGKFERVLSQLIQDLKDFKKEEVSLLINILEEKYKLKCIMQINTKFNLYTIYIKSESINNLQNLILPYFQKSMTYKLNYSASKDIQYPRMLRITPYNFL